MTTYYIEFMRGLDSLYYNTYTDRERFAQALATANDADHYDGRCTLAVVGTATPCEACSGRGWKMTRKQGTIHCRNCEGAGNFLQVISQAAPDLLAQRVDLIWPESEVR